MVQQIHLTQTQIKKPKVNKCILPTVMNAWMNQMDPIHLNRYKLPRPGNTSWKSFQIKWVSKTALCRRLISFEILAIIIVFVDIARRFHTFHYPINSMSDFHRISSSLALGGHPNFQAMWIISPWQWSNSLYLPLSLFHFGQLHSQSLSTLYKSHDIAAGILDKELRETHVLSLEPVSPKFSL